jgi:hypothetical protein
VTKNLSRFAGESLPPGLTRWSMARSTEGEGEGEGDRVGTLPQLIRGLSRRCLSQS